MSGARSGQIPAGRCVGGRAGWRAPSRTSACCGPSRSCSGGLLPIRRPRALPTPLLPSGKRLCGWSTLRGPKHASGLGSWPTAAWVRLAHRRRPGRPTEGQAADRQEETAALRATVEAHGRGRHAADLLRHQHVGPTGRRTRTVSPAASESRRPHPGRPLDRPAEPVPETHRSELDLAGDRPDRDWPAGLDAEVVPTGRARLGEARRLRLCLSTAAGQLVTTGRRRILRLIQH